jgi:hypothetical protein
MVLSPEKLSFILMDPLFIGDGAILYKDILINIFKNAAFFAPPQQNYIRAHTVALLAFSKLRYDSLPNLSPDIFVNQMRSVSFLKP